jgi:hypothetical protein
MSACVGLLYALNWHVPQSPQPMSIACESTRSRTADQTDVCRCGRAAIRSRFDRPVLGVWPPDGVRERRFWSGKVSNEVGKVRSARVCSVMMGLFIGHSKMAPRACRRWRLSCLLLQKTTRAEKKTLWSTIVLVCL